MPYIGIGSENWGCGGNMTPAYYADQYRQYLQRAQALRHLIATDANADDRLDRNPAAALYRRPPGTS